MIDETTATGTAQLFECSLEQAASWIDSNLPRAPNLENLTGCGPLPPSPAEASHSALDNELLEAQVQLAESSTELVETASSLFAPEDDHEQLPSQLEEGELPSETVTFDPGENDHSFSSPSSRFSPRPSRSPSFSPISSSPPAASLIDSNLPIFPDRSAFTESEYRREMPRTSTDSSPQHALPIVRLYLGGLPFGTRVVDIENLFQNMEVKCRVDWSTRDKDLNRFCFVDIESDQVSHSIQQLDGTRLGDRVITCAVARRALPEEEHRRRSRESDYSASRISNFVRPLDDLSNLSKRSTAPPRSPSPLNAVPAAYNLLILNLPLLETSQALDFLEKFPRCEVLQLKSRNQAVAFIGVNSEYDANYIIDHYGGRRISGEKISIVPIRKGLGAEEAVLEHFGRTDDSDVGEGPVAKKRRFD